MKDNKTEQEILDWWIMNTPVEYRNSITRDKDREKKILLMIDKELLLSRELSKNGRPEVVSEKEITEFYWKVSIEFFFSNYVVDYFLTYNKLHKRSMRSSIKMKKERGVPKEEIERFPKPNQICLWGIFHSLDMWLGNGTDELNNRKKEIEIIKGTK
jgi:hypothetical protein